LSIFKEKQEYFDINSKSEVIIGTIGRSEPYKGTATAIAAYRRLHAKNPKLKMKVAFGNVPPSDDLEIVEVKNDSELAEFYQSIDVLLVTCYSQHGAPHYPLIEGMACGTPVVHTDYYPGNEDNSWVAKSSELESVIQALDDFLATPNDCRKEKIRLARKTIEEHLSWEKVANSFIEKIKQKRI
jgi:glycosyltransferase involved in cell wall biosynthesis